MELLESDEKGRAGLQRAHALIQTVVEHAPSRPQRDTVARTPQVRCLTFNTFR
jgi:hypothetical protein